MTALGALLVAASGVLAGVLGAKALRAQAERARQLARMLELMRFELERFKTPLPDLFGALEARTDGTAAELCGRVSACLAAVDVRFSAAWRFACENLSKQEREILLPLGEILGRYGAEEQAAALDAALSDMRRLAEERRMELRDKSRLFLGLGAACGLLAAVLLW